MVKGTKGFVNAGRNHKQGEARELVLKRMNIESSKAALMPVTYQVPATPNSTVPAEEARAPAPIPKPKEEPLNQSAVLEMENRKRIALIEKAIGMNKSVIIEKDKERVGFIYKTIDKSTGEVTRIWPQQEVSSALRALADSDARSIMQGMMVNALV